MLIDSSCIDLGRTDRAFHRILHGEMGEGFTADLIADWPFFSFLMRQT
jgi:hypothetical protein